MGFLSNKIWVRIFLGHPVSELRSRSHTHENHKLWSWSHVHEKKSSGARAVSFLRWFYSPEVIHTVAGHVDDSDNTFL